MQPSLSHRLASITLAAAILGAGGIALADPASAAIACPPGFIASVAGNGAEFCVVYNGAGVGGGGGGTVGGGSDNTVAQPGVVQPPAPQQPAVQPPAYVPPAPVALYVPPAVPVAPQAPAYVPPAPVAQHIAPDQQYVAPEPVAEAPVVEAPEPVTDAAPAAPKPETKPSLTPSTTKASPTQTPTPAAGAQHEINMIHDDEVEEVAVVEGESWGIGWSLVWSAVGLLVVAVAGGVFYWIKKRKAALQAM
ncbi:hypothetical protein SAMN04489740_0210 [Arthrobacter alpinus]|uniref:Uncharacterized protein n=1 Tax=Arthrobacter alpinus TaxID=656366 RepID=A0A1H5ECK6_9MICC|nr:hypothetical protein [Arthrobacter alpinus]SED88842.1 hypothetical protein SAMN04489740_0210 [Arthrobacter alpinus]